MIKGEELLRFYQFNTNVAKHYFCTNCGIYTHNQRRANPNTYGINVGCLNGITEDELFKFKVRIKIINYLTNYSCPIYRVYT